MHRSTHHKTGCPCCGSSLDSAMRNRGPGDPVVCLGCHVILALDAELKPRVPEPGYLGIMLGEDMGFVERERPMRRRAGAR